LIRKGIEIFELNFEEYPKDFDNLKEILQFIKNITKIDFQLLMICDGGLRD